MSGPIRVSHNKWAYYLEIAMSGLSYGSYDECAYCMAVMISEPIVWQLR